MICLTGDVHHMSMRGSDQSFLHGSEAEAALAYVEIADRFGVRTTLFVTGKCVEEERRMLSTIAGFTGVEIGGHTFNAFKPLFLYRLSHLLLRRKNGPAFLQAWDIHKTLRTISTGLGIKANCWRDHGYRNDANTGRLLLSSGIGILSDARSPVTLSPFMDNGLWHFPINVLPDHDHIYHGVYQDRSGIRPGKSTSNPFGEGRLWPAGWFDLVKQQVAKIVEHGGVATLLVHPCCMEIADGFQVFSELCGYLSHFETLNMSDAIHRL